MIYKLLEELADLCELEIGVRPKIRVRRRHKIVVRKKPKISVRPRKKLRRRSPAFLRKAAALRAKMASKGFTTKTRLEHSMAEADVDRDASMRTWARSQFVTLRNWVRQNWKQLPKIGRKNDVLEGFIVPWAAIGMYEPGPDLVGKLEHLYIAFAHKDHSGKTRWDGGTHSMGHVPTADDREAALLTLTVLDEPYKTDAGLPRKISDLQGVVVHEYVHYMDSGTKRAGALFGKKGRGKIKRPGPIDFLGDMSKDMRLYFRDPLEVNAYFQNGATDMESYFDGLFYKKKYSELQRWFDYPQQKFATKALHRFWEGRFLDAVLAKKKLRRKLLARTAMLQGYFLDKYMQALSGDSAMVRL